MIEEIKRPNGSIHKRMTACPVCDKVFEDGRERKAHLLNDHSADDFKRSERPDE